MKKLLFLLLLVITLLGLHEAKRHQQSKQKEDYCIQSNDRRRSSKNNQNSHKQSRSPKNKKHKHQTKDHINNHSDQHQILHWNQSAFWWNVLLATFLSCAGGFFSGMTVGLNSLDKLSLEVQQITGNEEEKQKASRILNTIKDHHLFLVTLLIGNAMVLEYLPLVMHKLMPDWAAILMSTFAVVIVAEIVPMAYTTGPSKYKVAYFFAPMVNVCIKIYYIFAYPIARGLDKLLGVHDDTHIKRADFMAFVNDKKENQLKPLQITMFNQLFVGPTFTSVQKVMMPVEQVMVLCMSDQVTKQITQQILQNQVGFILIAKHTKDAHNLNIIAAIKTKQFVVSYLKKKKELRKSVIKIHQFLEPQFVIDPNDNVEASSRGTNGKEAILKLNQQHRIPVVYSDTGLLDLLGIMRAKRSSIALIHRDERINQNTNIAFIDASDHQVVYDPFSVQDKHSIIGVIMIDNVFEAIVDFNNEIVPEFQTKKQDSPVKKRRLVKKASIALAYSAMSQRSLS